MLRREFFGLVSTAALAWPVAAQAQLAPSASSPDPSSFDLLQGRWVRKDGGYVITIKAVDVTGKLDAGYANPNSLPFHTAVATSDGGVIKLFFELRAGGYNGSTYTLTFDAADNRLKGVYYQAVVKQKFDVVFERME
jgi:hypothetical protein